MPAPAPQQSEGSCLCLLNPGAQTCWRRKSGPWERTVATPPGNTPNQCPGAGTQQNHGGRSGSTVLLMRCVDGLPGGRPEFVNEDSRSSEMGAGGRGEAGRRHPAARKAGGMSDAFPAGDVRGPVGTDPIPGLARASRSGPTVPGSSARGHTARPTASGRQRASPTGHRCRFGAPHARQRPWRGASEPVSWGRSCGDGTEAKRLTSDREHVPVVSAKPRPPADGPLQASRARHSPRVRAQRTPGSRGSAPPQALGGAAVRHVGSRSRGRACALAASSGGGPAAGGRASLRACAPHGADCGGRRGRARARSPGAWRGGGRGRCPVRGRVAVAAGRLPSRGGGGGGSPRLRHQGRPRQVRAREAAHSAAPFP